MTQLHVNVDHIATIREARKTCEPSPLEVVKLLEKLDFDGGITTHLREDRRHIQDFDIYQIDEYLRTSHLGFTFEMAATEEIRDICLKTKAKLATLVPEKREEVTTEGGLNLISQKDSLAEFIKPIQANGTEISFFVDPDLEQINTAKEIGAEFIELHTGTYANLFIEHGDTNEKLSEQSQAELDRLRKAAEHAQSIGLKTNMGHGLTVANLPHIIAIPGIQELHIGHSLISNAMYYGIEESARGFLNVIERKELSSV